jgi:hypothetical protein
MRRLVALAVLLCASSALAAVGKVILMDGDGIRTPKEGAPVVLAVDSEAECEGREREGFSTQGTGGRGRRASVVRVVEGVVADAFPKWLEKNC